MSPEQQVAQNKQVQPEVLPPNQEGAEIDPNAQPEPEVPLVQRVAKMKIEKVNPPVDEATNPFGLTKEDYDKVNSDPVLSKFYKSMQSGLTKKTQEIADIKRSLESQTGQRWTPERIQQLLNDPEFIQSAQQVAGTSVPKGEGYTSEEWSTLTDAEKSEIIGLKREVSQLKQSNQLALKAQQDSMLQQTYANYDSQKVDTLLSQMMNGSLQATREHLWKVLDYEPAVDRAYKLGRQDERGGNIERVQSLSPMGVPAQPNQEIQPEKGESNENFWRRIIDRRLAEKRAGTQTRT